MQVKAKAPDSYIPSKELQREILKDFSKLYKEIEDLKKKKNLPKNPAKLVSI